MAHRNLCNIIDSMKSLKYRFYNINCFSDNLVDGNDVTEWRVEKWREPDWCEQPQCRFENSCDLLFEETRFC